MPILVPPKARPVWISPWPSVAYVEGQSSNLGPVTLDLSGYVPNDAQYAILVLMVTPTVVGDPDTSVRFWVEQQVGWEYVEIRITQSEAMAGVEVTKQAILKMDTGKRLYYNFGWATGWTVDLCIILCGSM